MTDQTTHDAVLAALDTWAQDWHRRHSNGASPAQPADNALLAAYDAHRAPTTTVRPLPTRDDLADDGIRWNTNATDYLHNLADRRLAAIRDLQRRSSDNLADADEARRERDLLIDAIARLAGIPPEQVAKTHGVRYDGIVDEEHLSEYDEPDDEDTDPDTAALAAAIEAADSARIDSRDIVWRPADIGWQHPVYGTLTLRQLEEQHGPTRPVLLVDHAADDSDMGDPPADWRINPTDPPTSTQVTA